MRPPNIKAIKLLEDHKLRPQEKTWTLRPLSQLKNLILLPALAGFLIPTLTTQTLSAKPPPTATLQEAKKEISVQERAPTPEEVDLLTAEPEVPMIDLLKLLQKTKEESKILSEKEKEEETAKYWGILENYRKNPPTLRELLTHAWEDTGLSRKDAEDLVSNSFQNKDLLQTNLNHRATFLYAQDLIDAPPLIGLENYFQSTNNTPLLVTLINAFNSNFQANIPPLEANETHSRERLRESWEAVKTFAENNPDCQTILIGTKALLDQQMQKMLENGAGFAAAGDHVYFLDKTQNPKNLFQLIATHEATHTAQKFLETPIVSKEFREHALAEELDLALENSQGYLAKKPHMLEVLRKTKKKKIEEDFDYLTQRAELPAWAGMIKKIYFQQTGNLLTQKSKKEDLETFSNWIKNPKMEEDSYRAHVIKQFQKLKTFMDKTPETQKLLFDNLKDVAKTQSKNEPTLC